MPRYFFDVTDGGRLIDPAGAECESDEDAVERAKILAVGVSLDKPRVDPKRHIAVINSEGTEISRVPIYSRPSVDVL